MAKLKQTDLDSQIASGGAWVGTPAEVRATIARTVERLGPFEHASLQINFGTLPFVEAQRSMRLFAAEVLPAFAEGASARAPG
jgi:hypothetical protein